MTELERLQSWYREQCNEDWEHSFGVKIDTLDNPGWMVKIDLRETSLEQKSFAPVSRGDSEADADWIACRLDAFVDVRFWPVADCCPSMACSPDPGAVTSV
jgi:hypothetical protein